MFDQIIKTIQDSAQSAIQGNANVPADKSEGIMNLASGSIVDTIKGLVSNGQVGDLMQLANNPNGAAAQLMQNDFVKNIVSKLGIDAGQASSIASSVIPSILSNLSLDKLTSGAGGLDMSAIGSMLAKTGLDKDGDGDVDLKDITKMFGF